MIDRLFKLHEEDKVCKVFHENEKIAIYFDFKDQPKDQNHKKM